MEHWAVKRALEDVSTLGWCERVYFREEGHELHGQWLGAIVGIQTDPATAERTGGITRTYIHRNVKIGKAKSLGGVGRLGIIRLSPDEEVGAGLHICEGIESALSLMQMGFCPMWAAGSTSQLKDFPVLAGVECLTIIADHDIADEAGKQASQQAARFARQRWAAAGRETVMKIPKAPGRTPTTSLSAGRKHEREAPRFSGRISGRTSPATIVGGRLRAWGQRRRPARDRSPCRRDGARGRRGAGGPDRGAGWIAG